MPVEQRARAAEECEERIAIGVRHDMVPEPCPYGTARDRGTEFGLTTRAGWRCPETPVVYNPEVFWKLPFPAVRLLHMVSQREVGLRPRAVDLFTRWSRSSCVFSLVRVRV